MWCSSCQQDVAAVADPGSEGEIRCARCQERMNRDEAAGKSNWSDGSIADLDDWELDADLRSVLRLTSSLRRDVSPQNTGSPSGSTALPLWSSAPVATTATRTVVTNEAARPRGGFFTWAVLSLGVTTFVCGGVLLAWSFVADRPDLRTLGLPLTLFGQAALIIGLVLQLEGLWHSNRQTRETLDDLDEQLDELRHATTLMSTSRSTAGQSFYAHLAEGASPELLLADLKGQMDLLAQKMASQRRAG